MGMKAAEEEATYDKKWTKSVQDAVAKQKAAVRAQLRAPPPATGASKGNGYVVEAKGIVPSSATAPSPSPAPDELKSMKVTQLQKLARQLSVAEGDIDKAMDADEGPKVALISVIEARLEK